ncbi:alanine racemase [Paenibacillus psychroresistens]|uniref:Alanine racemase n=1 Tax=Paenibacillus psychroresistens TaxID=1778678 RepID=A0A6B8RRK7_9BACL|nr:alanine racemase [Paenibacillus psychroresistens]QGQ98444.1 alanine racemase [Paenibacillus psychroresistens]
MDSFYRPTWVEISLDALQHNFHAFRQLIPVNVEIMAVVKADAYGHGAVAVAKEVMEIGAAYLAVAFLDEALELRRAGITAPILVLGYTSEQGLPLAIEYNITLNVYQPTILRALAALSSEEYPVNIHIKLDTGMGRLGLHDEVEAIAFIEAALALPYVNVEGIFTHYASADEADKTYTIKQHEKFDGVVQYFAKKKVGFKYIHAGNSAAAIDVPELTYNMVRLGISMYGLYPSGEVHKERIDLQPVMSLKTGVVHLKELPKGSGISYGTIYRTELESEWIATLPVGYADGFSRMLTSKAQALIHGQKVPIVGTICMDQCMINVSSVDGVQLEDEVVLLGRQGNSSITADELAVQLGTINYEITCMISHRVPRVYIRGGQVFHAVNLLQHHGI